MVAKDAVSDTVKIVVVVCAPILFFSILLVLALIYRHHYPAHGQGHFRCRRASSSFRPRAKPGSWDKRALPVCPGCSRTRLEVGQSDLGQHPQQPNPVNTTMLAQPHFQEKQLSIRRISSDPFLPDSFTRLNSIYSTLRPEASEAANASSDILPYGGGRKGSHASTIHPCMVANKTHCEANSLSSGVVAVGDRRPSVLSGGLSDRAEDSSLSVRKVSIGGGEEWLSVKGASLNASELPVRTIPYFSQYRASSISRDGVARERAAKRYRQVSHRPKLNISIPLPPTPSGVVTTSTLTATSTAQAQASSGLPSKANEDSARAPHSFSAAALQRISLISGRPSNFHVPRNQELQRRPEALRVASTRNQTFAKDRSVPPAASRHVSLFVPPGSALRGLKSTPVSTASSDSTRQTIQSTSSFGDTVGIDFSKHVSETNGSGGVFAGWRGFPPQQEGNSHKAPFLSAPHEKPVAKNDFTPVPGARIQSPISHTTPCRSQQPPPGTPAQALDKLTRGDSVRREAKSDIEPVREPPATAELNAQSDSERNVRSDKLSIAPAPCEAKGPKPASVIELDKSSSSRVGSDPSRLRVEISESSRTSTASNTSRITYLSDVVKSDSISRPNSVAHSSSTNSSPNDLKPPTSIRLAASGSNAGETRRKSTVRTGDRPRSVNFALAPGMGMGIAVGLGSSAESKGRKQ